MGVHDTHMGPNKRQIVRWHHTNSTHRHKSLWLLDLRARWRAARRKSFVYSGLHPSKDLYALSKILVAIG